MTGTVPKSAKRRQPCGGSRKGIPNKLTRTAREALALILDGNVGRVQEWLDRVAKRDPKGTLMAFIALLEYGVPKLSRTEIQADLQAGFAPTPEQADAILAAAQRKANRSQPQHPQLAGPATPPVLTP